MAVYALAALALSALVQPASDTVLPIDPRHVPPRLTAEWLAGTWVTGKEACYGTDFGVTYEADGTFSDVWFGGRFQISGSRVRHRVEALTDRAEAGDKVGERFSRRVKLIGPNEIEFDPGRDAERMHRCPAGGMPD